MSDVCVKFIKGFYNFGWVISFSIIRVNMVSNEVFSAFIYLDNFVPYFCRIVFKFGEY